jgi:hypothetical protein
MTTAASVLTDGLPAAPRMTNPVLAVLTRSSSRLSFNVLTPGREPVGDAAEHAVA